MSTQEIARINREKKARKQEFDDARIAIFKSQFKKDDKRIDDEDSDLAVEYVIDEYDNPVRNVYFKNAMLDPLRKVEALGYSYEEILSPEEKELSYGLYRPLPEKLRKKLGVTIKAGKRIRRRSTKHHHKKTRKGNGKYKGKGKKRYSFRVKR
jgi:hypothetical protein